MDDSNIIATLYPVDGGFQNLALDTVYLQCNRPFQVAPLCPAAQDTGDWSSGHTASQGPNDPRTPEPESYGTNDLDWARSPGLQLRFDVQRKQRRGFLVGRHEDCDIRFNPDTCPVGVSNFHCVIGFDDQARLTVTDLRDSTRKGDGTAVEYDGQGGAKRRGFTWLLSGASFTEKRIVLAIHNDIRFRIVVPWRDPSCPVHQHKIAQFRAGTMVDPTELPMAALDLEPGEFTALPSGVQTPMAGPIWLERPLDAGGFAIVTIVANVTTGLELAKKIPRSREDVDLPRWERERELLKKIDHPNIVQLMGDDYSNPRSPTLYFELVPGGSLSWQHRHVFPLSLSETLEVLRQLLSALQYLHGQSPPIVHRDIKPQNVLVQTRGGGLHVKLIDFGHSTGSKSNFTNIGTRKYHPPEVEENMGRSRRKPLSSAMDIWCLGVLVLELAFGLPSSAEGRWSDAILKKLGKQPAGNLVEYLKTYMLVRDPRRRGSASACLATIPDETGSLVMASTDPTAEERNTTVRGERPGSSSVSPPPADDEGARRSRAPSKSSQRSHHSSSGRSRQQPPQSPVPSSSRGASTQQWDGRPGSSSVSSPSADDERARRSRAPSKSSQQSHHSASGRSRQQPPQSPVSSSRAASTQQWDGRPGSSSASPPPADDERARRSRAPSKSSHRSTSRGSRQQPPQSPVPSSSRGASIHSQSRPSGSSYQALASVLEEPVTDGSYQHPVGYYHETFYLDPLLVGSSVAEDAASTPTLFRESYVTQASIPPNASGGDAAEQEHAGLPPLGWASPYRQGDVGESLGTPVGYGTYAGYDPATALQGLGGYGHETQHPGEPWGGGDAAEQEHAGPPPLGWASPYRQADVGESLGAPVGYETFEGYDPATALQGLGGYGHETQHPGEPWGDQPNYQYWEDN